MQVAQFYRMHSIFDIDNMRAVGEFNSVGDFILVAHKLTSACKPSDKTTGFLVCCESTV